MLKKEKADWFWAPYLCEILQRHFMLQYKSLLAYSKQETEAVEHAE